jgi:hypothetical protein
MSVLLPGPDDLRRRVALGEYAQHVKTWLLAIQDKAWEYVNTFPGDRPQKIFLVTGQTLANEYAISHSQRASLSCEVTVEGEADVPNLINSKVFVGYQWGRVSASSGFEIVARRSPIFHSLFLQVYESSPQKTLGKRYIERLIKVHAYSLRSIQC